MLPSFSLQKFVKNTFLQFPVCEDDENIIDSTGPWSEEWQWSSSVQQQFVKNTFLEFPVPWQCEVSSKQQEGGNTAFCTKEEGDLMNSDSDSGARRRERSSSVDKSVKGITVLSQVCSETCSELTLPSWEDLGTLADCSGSECSTRFDGSPVRRSHLHLNPAGKVTSAHSSKDNSSTLHDGEFPPKSEEDEHDTLADTSSTLTLCTPHEVPSGSHSDEADDLGDHTTVIIQNIPDDVKEVTMREVLDSSGFKDSYDFVFLPRSGRTKAQRKFVFVNFTSAALAQKFHSTFHGKQFPQSQSDLLVQVRPAHIQGSERNSQLHSQRSQKRVRRGGQSRSSSKSKPDETPGPRKIQLAMHIEPPTNPAQSSSIEDAEMPVGPLVTRNVPLQPGLTFSGHGGMCHRCKMPLLSFCANFCSHCGRSCK